MKAAYAKYRLNFIVPGGTSRGVLTYKDTYFLKIWEPEEPERFGIGECALFKGLSAEDDNTYEAKLQELCRNISMGQGTDLVGYSSIMFGFETAILDYSNGCQRMLYPTPFCTGKYAIPINGLVWMGSKEEMQARMEEKLAAGFKTIKIKIGAIDFDAELDLIKSLRSRFPADVVEIRVDANGAFTPQNVMSRLEALSQYSIHSIEQPIKQGQWEEMARVCRNSPLPVALDEELIGIDNPMMMMELIKTIRPHYLVLKPSLVGGFSGATTWLKMAAQFNIGAWITSALESNIGLNALAQWVATLQPKIPQGLGTGRLFSNNIQSPLEQTGETVSYNPQLKWEIPPMDWIEF